MSLGLDSNWTLRIVFWLSVSISILIMKAISAYKTQLPDNGFWLTPVCAVESWNRSPPATPSDWRLFVGKAFASLLALTTAYLAFRKVSNAVDARGWLLSYLAVPILVVFELSGDAVRFLCLATGKVIPNVHNHLLRSSNISDFWRRYNVWVSEWFYHIVFKPLRRSAILASFAVFLFSGIWHELLVNVPLLMIFHVNMIGSMLGYFLFQWFAVVIDRSIFSRTTPGRRLFAYAAIIGPAPLILNEGLLRIFGWWRA
ncbi:MAG: hypothetical protein C5B49_10400 [Bdellovibrio sp.]|nr:MAG: hypothetical protein C5B49_10400 [Bdellovibrio sp.]